MNNPQSVSHTFSGTDKTVSFETGRLAGLAGGAVLAQLGDTTVLVTATGAKSPRPGARARSPVRSSVVRAVRPSRRS